MEIRNFKVTSVTSPQGTNAPSKRIEFTCEGKGRIVDWNWIEGFAFGPLENDEWHSEWVVIIQRGGTEIKRKMKLTQRSMAINSAINLAVEQYIASNGLKDRAPVVKNSKKYTPAKVDLVPVKMHPKVTKKDSLDIPEFLRR